MHHTYKTSGVCSSVIDFDIKDNKVYNVKYTGGCNGNLKAVSSLVEGQDIDSIETHSEGTDLDLTINFIKDTQGYRVFDEEQ